MVESLQMFVFLFKSKYRRKSTTFVACAVFVLLLVQQCLCVIKANHQQAPRCNELNCLNGVCKNDTCLCNDGWQGPECQFCGGKVRLAEPFGSIHDGPGNYSVGVKCSWLIDARSSNYLPSHSLSSSSSSSMFSPNHTIRLHIEEFATECGWDHLYVYDGDSVDSPLLAVFSGLMYKDSYSIRRVPEIVARSGSALLHFFSDDAYNMSGFNVTYRVGPNACPTRDSSVNCSGHGVCSEGVCICEPGWLGSACDQAVCPANCSSDLGQGVCDHEHKRCQCGKGFRGSDCSQHASRGWWRAARAKDFSPPGSAGHCAVVWKDSLHVIAGESYSRANALVYTYDFNGNVWETVHADRGAPSPSPRYGASAVIYGDKVFMYGGVLSAGSSSGSWGSQYSNEHPPKASGRKSGGPHHRMGGGESTSRGQVSGGACNELWAYDVSAKTWENITVRIPSSEKCDGVNSMCGPLKSAGHTATLITSYDIKKSESMIIIFGHSPEFGYLNTVQEFNFGTREWRILETRGYPVKGGYGHSASYDELTHKIYVYGGIISESESNQYLTSKLYSFEPKTRIWKLLTPAPSSRFLHTANFVSEGLMLVFGGNTHNDTSHSFGAKCYSNELLAYDVVCDSWHELEIPRELHADLARFGHSAVLFESALYIYGGFNGQMLSDMLKYTPGDCVKLLSEYECLNTRPGVKCVWDVKDMKCIKVKDISGEFLSGYYEEYDMRYMFCPEEGRTSKGLMDLTNDVRCSEQQDCYSCVQNKFDCVWCVPGDQVHRAGCYREKCRKDVTTGSDWNRRIITDLDECPADNRPVCKQLHTCHACRANRGKCSWDYENPKCKAVENRTIVAIQPASVDIQSSSVGHPSVEISGGIDLPTLLESSSLDHHMNAPTSMQSVATPPCAPPCSELSSCHNCTQEECIWCQNEGRCVDKNAYTASFPYGQCREWTTVTSRCRSAVQGESQCTFYSTCAQCLGEPACGWCDDGSDTGLGACLAGGASGPHQQDYGFHQTTTSLVSWEERTDREHSWCPADRWHFTTCPSCQCNGHSTCPTNSSVCRQPCDGPAIGPHCDNCEPGYWGDPVNGGTCQPCECNGQASLCNSETGKCYCTTKGLAGDHCEKCDANNHYHEDPNNKGSCYYDLTIDYQFTFNLSKKEDRHYTKINFRNSPIKPDIDADFTITCSVLAKMNISIKSVRGQDKPIFQAMNCTQFRHKFSKAEYNFGMEDNVTLTTFYVSVYDFQPPLWIQISFSQYPKLNLQQFFITFSTCFLLLLLVAAIMWKIKQKWDMYRRRQRLFVEMEQMASRPFSQVLVEIESKDTLLLSQDSNNITTVRKRKKDSPSPIALEPCNGNRAAVLSLLVRLPSGSPSAGLCSTPSSVDTHASPTTPTNNQSRSWCQPAAGLAVASALVTLGNPRKTSVDQSGIGKDLSNSGVTVNAGKNAKRKNQSQHPADGCI